jgi:hypothetical protein
LAAAAAAFAAAGLDRTAAGGPLVAERTARAATAASSEGRRSRLGRRPPGRAEAGPLRSSCSRGIRSQELSGPSGRKARERTTEREVPLVVVVVTDNGIARL